MKHLLRGIVIPLLLLAFNPGTGSAQSSIRIELDPQESQIPIAPEFAGLSFEMTVVLPKQEGMYYFDAKNAAGIQLFHTLGLKSLRVGANAVDDPKVAIPNEADADHLFAFAKAAGIKVIYSFRLKNGNPDDAAALAKYISDHYAANLDCFCIGNEADAYYKTYEEYVAHLRPFYETITRAVPSAKFCGTGCAGTNYNEQYIADFGKSGTVSYICSHLYELGQGRRQKDPVVGRDNMLNVNATNALRPRQNAFNKLGKLALDAGLPYRVEETNNYSIGGALDMSDTYASAIWGVDYMYWWASQRALGINFHSGNKVSAAGDYSGSKYTPFVELAAGGFEMRPLAYGIAAFNLGGHGKLIPAKVTVTSAPDPVATDARLRAYATIAPDNSIYVTAINRSYGNKAEEDWITLAAPPNYTHAKVISLTMPGGDVAAKTGMTLGGAPIEKDGSWQGQWTALPDFAAANGCRVKVPAATVAVIKLSGSPGLQLANQ